MLFEDVLSEHLDFVRGSEGLAVNGQKITASISIGAMESVTLTWTAKVKETAPVGALIESNATALGGVSVFDTANFVGAYTAAQLEGVAKTAREIAALGTGFDDPAEFARTIYREALGVDILQDTTAAALIADLFALRSSDRYDLRVESALASMAVPRLHGGTLLHRLCDIVAMHVVSDFMLGDLIFCQKRGQYHLFVYVGDGELVQIDTQSKSTTLMENGTDFCSYKTDAYVTSSIASQLRTYELCVVLRPTMCG